MATEDLVTLLIVATYVVLSTVERLWPARQFPPVRGWLWIGVACFFAIGALNATLPALLPVDWLRAHSLVQVGLLGTAGAILIGYPLTALVGALVHRALHRYDLLWRTVHQLHHAPVRVDMPGSVIFHPLDVAQSIVFAQIVAFGVLGATPEAAAWIGYVSVFYGMFQHCNIRTPPWLGYLIQRPESHCVHHSRDVHGYNYSDFPLWDLAMGSFRNPPAWSGEAGFADGASRRVAAMLAGRDVNPQLDNGGGGGIA
jgi:sterol desaturase/sphingolipid hydroxylase (fatty acid hydroxylase superfamily)